MIGRLICGACKIDVVMDEFVKLLTAIATLVGAAACAVANLLTGQIVAE